MFVVLCVFLSKHDYTVEKFGIIVTLKSIIPPFFQPAFLSLRMASSAETISDEASVDKTKDQMDLSDLASGPCWIVFSCYLQT